MKKKRELLINDKTISHIYTYHSYPLSILTTEDKCGNEVAEFNFRSENNIWTNDSLSLNFNLDNNGNCKVTAKEYERNRYGFMYGLCNEDDELVARIDKHMYTHPWSVINLFITKSKEDITDDQNSLLYRVGRSCHGDVFVKEHDKFLLNEYLSDEIAFPFEIRIKRRGDLIIFSCLLRIEGKTIILTTLIHQNVILHIIQLIHLFVIDLFHPKK